MPTSLDSPPASGIQILNRIGRAQYSPHLGVVVQERDELLPGVVSQSDDRRILLAPTVSEILERCPRGSLGRGSVDRSEIVFERIPILPGRHRNVLRIKWITHVWTVVAGHTFSTTSGRPFNRCKPGRTRPGCLCYECRS